MEVITKMLTKKYIESKIVRFDRIISILEEIKDSYDYDKYSEVLKLHRELSEERESDLKKYPESELKKYNFYFAGKIKQIEYLSDDIIENLNKKKKDISKRLTQIQNKKKITVYKR